jgi:hypothetical protein
MVVAPIIFYTVVHGIASAGQAQSVGRIAIKAIVYFFVITTLALALALALVLVNFWDPKLRTCQPLSACAVVLRPTRFPVVKHPGVARMDGRHKAGKIKGRKLWVSKDNYRWRPFL